MSNYKKVKKQSDNPFLNLYKLDAVDREGKVFDYYFVSRRDEEHIKLKTKDNTPEGIVVYAVTDSGFKEPSDGIERMLQVPPRSIVVLMAK